MLELATLGLLQQQSLHGYRLKQQLELFMSGCISVNYGAIYPMLRRLEMQGDIETEAEESSEAGPSRKVYRITSQGRNHWRQLMLSHPHESWVNSRSRFMIKFFFFQYLEPAERLKLLQYRQMNCQMRLERLEEEVSLYSDPYQILAWQRHLDNLRSEAQWLQQQIATEVQCGSVSG